MKLEQEIFGLFGETSDSMNTWFNYNKSVR